MTKEELDIINKLKQQKELIEVQKELIRLLLARRDNKSLKQHTLEEIAEECSSRKSCDDCIALKLCQFTNWTFKEIYKEL